jgi:hypothetical protein
MNRTRWIVALLAGAAVVGGTLGTVAATSGADSQAPPPATAEVPTAAQTANLTPAELALLSSGQPINVVMDPTTGDIESVVDATLTQPR